MNIILNNSTINYICHLIILLKYITLFYKYCFIINLLSITLILMAVAINGQML